MSGGGNLKGKVILVTGATDGLGRALSLELAKAGATVLAHGRDAGKCEALVQELQQAGAGAARAYVADFSSLEQVRAMAESVAAREPALHVLVNNAGLGIEKARKESQDGLELIFQVNALAGHLLTHRLLPLLKQSAPARIVNVASAGQWPINFDDVMMQQGWHGAKAYGQSKLAQILLTFDWAKRLEGTGVTCNALHPASLMPTKIVIGLMKPTSTVEDGVRNVMRLVADPALEGVTGRYFDQANEARANEQAYDEKARERLRELSDRYCGL